MANTSPLRFRILTEEEQMKRRYVCVQHNYCTCGGGRQVQSHYPHERYCGEEPIAPFMECISPSAAFDFSQVPGLVTS